jgi:FkbM family methyltransferase
MKLGKGKDRSGDTKRKQREVTHVTVHHRRRDLVFAIDNPDDAVQSHLSRGTFYEPGLLRHHADMIFEGSTVLDVGANIGNHTVFYALTRAARVYPFEPHPRANALLRKTVELNGLEEVDLTHVDFGIGSEEGELFVRTPSAGNLGASRLDTAGSDMVKVQRLDNLAFTGPVSFIKIDVEGMEMDVLDGASELIAEHRPAVGIEVDNENAGAFWDWADTQRYEVVHALRMYPRNVNYVCVPRGPR